MNSKVAFDYFAAFAGFIALSVLVALALSVSGCSIAPRNQTYCSQNMKWVKCPKGVEPGSIIDKDSNKAKNNESEDKQ